jgi:apolipoprotein N-acyltransferase
MKKALLVAFLAGAATVLGFAPFGLFPLPILTLALLFHLWRRAASPRQAAWQGFAWGLGCFLAGVSWVYVSLHDVGGMALPLAAVATLLFCVWLSLFPTLAGYLFRRVATADFRSILLAAGLWTLTEWLRGWLLTGFPWLAIGYSQAPPSPLAGYAPIVGVYGVGLLVAGVASWLTFGWRRVSTWIGIAAIVGGGFALRPVAWTQPVGAPLTVSLLQGNIPQSLKWVPEHLQLSLETYARLADQHPAQLTVLPETAVPLLLDQIPREFLHRLTRHGDVMLGSVLHNATGYTNAALALSSDGVMQAYSKAHLVPFGEFVPPGFAWFFGLVNIPMSDFSAGAPNQPPLVVRGQRLMPNICYEDLFGEELLAALPRATLLVNLSNTAWFGDSLAQPQHLQIARMRALETGRPILRATNTGMTAALAPDGVVIAALPPFTADALTVSVRGHTGLTPYARIGNALALALAGLAIVASVTRRSVNGRTGSDVNRHGKE